MKACGCRSSQRSAIAADAWPSAAATSARMLRAVARAGRFGIVQPPHVPVDRRQDAPQVAEQELQLEDGALLFSPAGGSHGGVDVAAHPVEEVLVARGVAPAQVGVEHVASEIVRQQAIRSGLDEGQVAQPGEQLVRILELERVPQERLGGHPGQRAHLEGAALPADGDDVDEPPHERADEIRRRVQGRLPAADDHVGEQGEAQRMTVGDLDEAVVKRLVDTARA